MKRTFRLLVAALCWISSLGVGRSSAATYYIDSSAPNDSNSGTSPATAWKTLAKVNATSFAPGDSILFKRGVSWTGTLSPCNNTCSGSPGQPITISAYGTAGRPIINGNGVLAAVSLNNQSHWEIRNLEITNETTTGTRGSYWGIRVVCNKTSSRVCEHIYIGSNYIHNVEGLLTSVYEQAGGIAILSYLFHPLSGTGGDQSNYFNDVTIENNIIDKVDSQGIMVANLADGAIDKTCTNYPCGPQTFDCNNAHLKSNNVVISNNSISCVSSFGITNTLTSGSVVSHNSVSKVGYSNYPSPNSCTNPGAGGAGILTAAVANTTLEYNEIFNGNALGDGQAIDADWGSNGVGIRYNYSHNNLAGFLLLWETHKLHGASFPYGGTYPTCSTTIDVCGSESTYVNDVSVKHNLSINDGAAQSVFMFCGAARTTSAWGSCTSVNTDTPQVPWGAGTTNFMNNTIFLDASHRSPILRQCYSPSNNSSISLKTNDGRTQSFKFYNNIVYPVSHVIGTCTNSIFSCVYDSDCTRGVCDKNYSWIGTMTGAYFDYNSYYGSFGGAGLPFAGVHDHVPPTNPLLLAPTALGAVGEYPPMGSGSLTGFKLRSGSPSINSALQNGLLGPVDFWGNSVASSGSVSRGAYNGPGINITMDQTSGWFTPASSTEWTNLLNGSGLAGPSSLWLMQQSTGTLSDSLGSRHFLVGGGSPGYQAVIPNWARVSVKPRSAFSDYFGASFAADISTTSALLLMIVRLNAAPATQRPIFLQGYSAETNRVDINASGRLVARNKANSVTGTLNQANRTIVIVMKVDRSIPQIVVYNNGEETLRPTWSAPASGTTLYFGNLDGTGTWPDASIAYGAYWTGTNAQMTDAQVATLITRIKNGH
jgi:Right handed beta helix region